MALIKKVGTQKSGNGEPDGGDTNTFGTGAPGTRRMNTPTMQSGVVLQDRYLIEGTLGVGGMSVVYRGRDLRFKDVVRPCVIKESTSSAAVSSGCRRASLKKSWRESSSSVGAAWRVSGVSAGRIS
jgi:hypothetical protein